MVTFVHFLLSVDLYTMYFEAPVTFFQVTVACPAFEDLSEEIVGFAQSVPFFSTLLTLPATFFELSRAVTLNWYFFPAVSFFTVAELEDVVV